MSIYLAKEWQVRSLLRGTMTRAISKKPIDPRGGELLFKETWCRANVEYAAGPIEIDGEDLIVVGTEMQHPWKPGDEIGILVKPAPGRRIELGIDGRAAYALLGQDIQSGECEFVDIEGEGVDAELIAAKKALLKLRDRLGMPDAPFYFGNSHPYGNG